MSSETVSLKTSASAQKYQAIKNRLFLFNLCLEFGFLIIFIVSGASLFLRVRLAELGGSFFSLNALYLVCFCSIAFFLSLPLEFYEGFILEHRFGLSRESGLAWLKDVLKKSYFSFLIFLVMVEAVYYFLLHFPETWWLCAAFFWFFITVVLTKISPQWILPLFFHPTPLSEGFLKERIEMFLSRYSISCKKVSVLDFSKKTVKANALVAGLGASKEIFLSDTLVEEFSPDEIEVVLAHEIGHYIHRDSFKLIGVNLVTTVISYFITSIFFNRLVSFFGLNGISDVAGLPLLLISFIFLSMILLPLQNGMARALEHRADVFSVCATGNPKAFVSAMMRLGEKNLSEFSPSKIKEIFLYDHPPLSKRIEWAEGLYDAKNP
jgi:STE24 endopeptidase